MVLSGIGKLNWRNGRKVAKAMSARLEAARHPTRARWTTLAEAMTARLVGQRRSLRVVTSGILRRNWRNGRSWFDDGPEG